MPLNMMRSAKGDKVFKLIASTGSSRADVMRVNGSFAANITGVIFDEF
jgi:hypothetical protein